MLTKERIQERCQFWREKYTTVYENCLVRRSPRLILKPYGPQFESKVMRFTASTTHYHTRIYVCQTDGKLFEKVIVKGLWSSSKGGKIVDLNRDGKPDLVKVNGKKLYILLNESSDEHLTFSKRIQRKFSNVIRSNAFWFADMNGDGLNDFVVKYNNQIHVRYGRGNLYYNDQPVVFLLKGYTNSRVNSLNDFKLVSSDVNKDGLADIVAYNKDKIRIFINVGKYYQEPNIKAIRSLNIRGNSFPHLVDFSGTGNDQVTATLTFEAYFLELNTAGTGLMTKADDGKGNVIEFKYKKMNPEINVGYRRSIISNIKVTSSGYGTSNKIFKYNSPVFNTQRRHFLGYNQVKTIAKNMSKTATYRNNDYFVGKLTQLGLSDPRIPNLKKVITYKFDEVEWGDNNKLLRAQSQSNAWEVCNQQVVSKSEDYLQYDKNQCLLKAKKNGPHGTLISNTKFLDLSASDYYANHMHCLPEIISIEGKHLDQKMDFIHNLTFDRNDRGLPKIISIGGGATGHAKRIVQKINYHPDNFQVDSIFDAKTGKSRFIYDTSNRLKEVILPTGEKKVATDYFDNIDQVKTFTHFRGDEENFYQQYFRFDSYERLKKQWSNLSSTDESLPDLEYEYKYATNQSPAVLGVHKRVNSDSFISSIKEYAVSAANGKEIAAIKQGLDLSIIQNLSRYDVDALSGSHYSIYTVPKYLDPNAISFKSLYAKYDNNSLVETYSKTDSFLGYNLTSSTLYQEGVIGNFVTDFAVNEDEQMQKRVVENENFETSHLLDFDKVRMSYTDEGGNTFTYGRDALGRIREIKAPNGNKHTVAINNLGEIARITKDDLLTVLYSYFLSSGNLKQKKYLDKTGKFYRKVKYENYDMGRPKVITNYDLISGDSSVTKFGYDGDLLSRQNIAGQAGFNTAVSSDKFKKFFTYRSDGKILSSELNIALWRTVKEDFNYYSNGQVRNRVITVIGNKGSEDNILITLDLSYILDKFGRVTELKINNKTILNYHYDHLSRVNEVDLPNDEKVLVGYDKHTGAQNSFEKVVGSKTLFKEKWNLNPRGLIESEEFSIDSSISQSNTVDSIFHRNYFYNSRKFLKTVEQNDQKMYVYSYDNIGLIDSFLDNNNISEDNAGRVITRGQKSYVYGANGRISKVLEEGQVLAEYIYDEKNLPLAKIKDGKFIEAYTSSGQRFETLLTTDAFYFPIVVAGRIVGFIENDKFITVSTDKRNSYLVDEDGNLNLSAPYGNRSDHSNKISELIDFAGKGFDKDLGLVRMGHRFYDPIAKMFLTPDFYFLENADKCAQSPVECNLYSYASNDPVYYVDPTGEALIATLILGAISLGTTIYGEYQIAKQASLPPMQADALGIQPSYAIESAFGMGISTLSLGRKTFGILKGTNNAAPDFKKIMDGINSSKKLSSQMRRRNVSLDSIQRALKQKPVATQGKINPAYRYIDLRTGNSVTIDKVTGAPFQVAPGSFKFD